jgi:hypothetical protein
MDMLERTEEHAVLCYVMVPLQHTRQRRGVGGGGFHGIRSVGGGAQPLDQQSGACSKMGSLRVCSTGSHTGA